EMEYQLPKFTTRSPLSTCAASLANGASCNLVLTFTAPATAGEIRLDPLVVCSGRFICSQPNSVNRVTITIFAVSREHKAYVISSAANNLTAINTAENKTVGEPITVGTNPVDMVITPNGEKGYVTNLIDGTVSSI